MGWKEAFIGIVTAAEVTANTLNPTPSSTSYESQGGNWEGQRTEQRARDASRSTSPWGRDASKAGQVEDRRRR